MSIFMCLCSPLEKFQAVSLVFVMSPFLNALDYLENPDEPLTLPIRKNEPIKSAIVFVW